MNLSNYIHMPPAPSVSKSLGSGATSGAAAGVSLDAGGSLGLDFAQIMARQFKQLPGVERQDLAAAPASQEDAGGAQTRQTAERTDSMANSRDDSPHQTQRQRVDQDNANDASAEAQAEEEATNDRTSTRARSRAAARTPMTQWPSAQAMLMQPGAATMASSAMPTAVDGSATQTGAALLDASASSSTDPLAGLDADLQSFNISARMRIITDPRQAPNPASLTAFAESMGMAPGAIQQLMGQRSANGLQDAALLNAGGNPLQSQTDAPHGAQAAPFSASQTLLNALANGLSSGTSQATPAAGPAGDIALNLPTAPNSALNLAAAVSAPAQNALQGLTPADLATISQVQITVLPGANPPASANSSAPTTTAAVLSLMGGTLSEQDISALASAFEQGDTGAEAGTDQQHNAPHDSGTSGFAQALTSHGARASANSGTPESAAAQHKSMTEVYDQLSDKLSTEMAARINKQLTDGEWKMKFGLRPAHLGGVEIQLEMKDGKLSAMLQADNPLTRDLLQNGSQRLRESLESFGAHSAQVHVGQDGGQSRHQHSQGSSTPSQFGDNAPLQRGDADATSVQTTPRKKDSASALDLYA